MFPGYDFEVINDYLLDSSEPLFYALLQFFVSYQFVTYVFSLVLTHSLFLFLKIIYVFYVFFIDITYNT